MAYGQKASICDPLDQFFSFMIFPLNNNRLVRMFLVSLIGTIYSSVSAMFNVP